MAFIDGSQPLGLPRGSIRAIIALAFTGAIIAMFVTGTPMNEAVLASWGLIVGNYFGSRGTTSTAEDVEVAKPYIPGDDDNT